jgi:hypothetical protein
LADAKKTDEGAQATASPAASKTEPKTDPHYFAAARFSGVFEHGIHTFEEGEEIVARLGEYFHRTGAPVHKED